MVEREDALLCGQVQVDEQVPAADQVELGEGGVAGDVVPREDAEVADRLGDLVLAVHLVEESLEPLGRHVQGDVIDVAARPGDGQVALADVGRQDLQRRVAPRVAEALQQRDGQRVDLLAGRAAGDPDPDRRARRAAADQAREDVPLQRLEGGRVAEEVRHPDEEVIVEGDDLLGLVLERLLVAVEVLLMAEHHPPLDPPQDRPALVPREVDARVLPDQIEDLPQPGLPRLVAGGHRVPFAADAERVVADPRELEPHGRGREDMVDEARAHGAAGHAVVAGGGLVLGDRDPAGRLDLLDAHGPVGAAAGEDHADGAPAQLEGHRAEEDVDRHVQAGPPGAEAQTSRRRPPCSRSAGSHTRGRPRAPGRRMPGGRGPSRPRPGSPSAGSRATGRGAGRAAARPPRRAGRPRAARTSPRSRRPTRRRRRRGTRSAIRFGRAIPSHSGGASWAPPPFSQIRAESFGGLVIPLQGMISASGRRDVGRLSNTTANHAPGKIKRSSPARPFAFGRSRRDRPSVGGTPTTGCSPEAVARAWSRIAG